MKRLGRALFFFLLQYMIFFLLCGFVVTCSFLLFFSHIEIPQEQIYNAARYTFGNVALIALIFVICDVIRRHISIYRPVKQINHALEQISAGDFDFRLDPKDSDPNFAHIKRSINRMAQELSGVETLRTDFIASVSHELKTPMAVIRNNSALLRQRDLPESKRLEYADIIDGACRRLSDLVTNILKLNRLENQQIYPKTEPYDLSEQLCQCLLQFENVWEEKSIDLDTRLEDEVIVSTDRELLELVWNNLLSNAFKFTEPGGTVSVSTGYEAEHIVVTVRDTGCGMPPEIGTHIFEKFYQGDTAHAAEGNGLGLALVKRIIDIIGGEISVSSTLGEGSSFTVRLRR